MLSLKYSWMTTLLVWLFLANIISCHAMQAVLDDGRKRELQNVIQSHFKEWVVNTGNMRQVYDLARMERGDGASTPHAL